jgi:hypothetical protein
MNPKVCGKLPSATHFVIDPLISRRTFLKAIAATSSLAVARQGPFQRYPNVQNVSANGASISWTTRDPAASIVRLIDPDGGTRSVPAQMREFDPFQTGMPAPYYQYTASVDHLEPGSSYTYQIYSNGQILPEPFPNSLKFRTPGPGPFQFLHFADSGDGNDVQADLSTQMLGEEDIALVIANGDLAYDLSTCESIEANYYGMYREMMAKIPFFATLGNHEYYTSRAEPSLAARQTPTNGVRPADWGRYYSFDWGNAHFVCLDSNTPLAEAATGTGAMLDWLQRDLQATDKFWRIAIYHHPGYAVGKHQATVEVANVRKFIVPILEKHGVQLVLNGHEHTYQRTHELLAGKVVEPNSGGIVHITSGGGGAWTYYVPPGELQAASIGDNHYVHASVADSTLTLTARGLGDAGDIDSVVLKPAPRIQSVANLAVDSRVLLRGGIATLTGFNFSPYRAMPEDPERGMQEAYGCSVTLNGIPLVLTAAAPQRIDARIPQTFAGLGKFVVTTPNGSAVIDAEVLAQPPPPIRDAPERGGDDQLRQP